MANNDLYTIQLLVFLHTDGIVQEKNDEMFFQQDSDPLHFSHEV
jgi:hypothetical protein